MNKGLLSFCCLSYNHGKYIESCIRSIWAQDYKNCEILVLDDGSTDNSVEVLNRLKTASPVPMQIIAQHNTGKIGANFNKMINACTGEFLVIISCDDKFIPNTIKAKVQEMLENESLAFICHSQITSIDENDAITTDIVPPLALDACPNPSINDVLELEYVWLGAYYMQGAIYRTELAATIGGFDDDLICDDIVFRTKIGRYLQDHPEWTFKVAHYPGVYYRRHSSNISSNAGRQIKGVMEYLDRYWPDRDAPQMLFDWLNHAVSHALETEEQVNDLFFNNGSASKIFNNKYAEKVFNTPAFRHIGLYKKKGMGNIFTISKYRKLGKKIKIIKLLGITLYKSSN